MSSRRGVNRKHLPKPTGNAHQDLGPNPERLRRANELRRSSATQPHADRRPRRAINAQAIREQVSA